MNALRALSLVLLAFGGYMNATYASLGGPANLILVGAALAGLLVAYQVVSLRARVGPVIPLLLIAIAFGYGIAAADTSGPYGQNKIELLLTLSPLSFVAGAWLADTDRRREWLAWGVAGWGLLAVLVQWFDPDQQLSDLGRLAGEELSYQALSRAAAAGAVVLAVLSLSRRFATRWRMVAFAAAIGFTAVAIGGGSRGPMLGLLVAVAVVAFRTPFGAALVAVGGVAAWYMLPTLLLPLVPGRLLSLNDASTRVRAEAAELTLLHIRDNSLGTGFGSLEWVVAPAGPRNLYYPHNIVLELAAEAGLLAAAVFIGAIAVVGYRLWRYGTTVGDDLTLSLLVYFFINACVSGDINSNRGVWLFLGVSCAAAYSIQHRRESESAQVIRTSNQRQFDLVRAHRAL